jgi:cobalt/nickel transport system permease protein
MNSELPSFLITSEIHSNTPPAKKKYSLSFIDRTLKSIAGIIKVVYIQNDTATKKGLLQMLDARIKSLFLFFFIIIISLNRQISSQLFITVFFFALLVTSKVNLAFVYKKVVVLSFFFGFLVIAPAALNIVTNGDIMVTIFRFKTSHSFWIYHVPAVIGITKEGCWVVLRFYLKVANSLTLTLMIIYTTPFNDIIKSLRIFRVPNMFLLILTLTYKFIFILSQTIEETYFAMKSRWWKNAKGSHVNQMVAGRINHIFRKSWIKYEEIYHAMVARGYTGTVSLIYTGKLKWQDFAFLLFALSTGVLCFFI